MKFQRIQDLRTDADLSQRELSEILHISQRSYSHYETGSRNIPIEMLIRLANYYDTSIDYLVGRTDRKKEIPGNVEQFREFPYRDSLIVKIRGFFILPCFIFLIIPYNRFLLLRRESHILLYFHQKNLHCFRCRIPVHRNFRCFHYRKHLLRNFRILPGMAPAGS